MNNSPIEAAADLRGRLLELKGQWPKVARDAGLDYSWLSKFGQGQISNPTVAKLQRLHEYFNGINAA